MNEMERAELIQILQHTERYLEGKIDKVSEELFQFKPDAHTWSMAELVEHLMITDQSLLAGIIKKGQRLYAEMPDTFPNEKIIKATSNRKYKVKAPDYLVPQGRFKNKVEALQSFRKSRQKVEDFVANTNLPMDKIAFPHFALGLIDGKGWITFMAGHCQRHSDQMEEIVEAWRLKK